MTIEATTTTSAPAQPTIAAPTAAPVQQAPAAPSADQAAALDAANRLLALHNQNQQQHGQQFENLLQNSNSNISTDTRNEIPQTPQQAPQEGLNTLTVEDVSSPIAKRAIQLLNTVSPGVDRNRAIGRALENGDVNFIDRAYIQDVAGDNADLVIGVLEDVVNDAVNEVQSVAHKIYDSVGGEAEFQKIATAYANAVDPATKRIVAQLLDSGDMNQVQFALQTIVQYSQQNRITDTPARRVNAAGAASNQEGFRALTNQDYRTELGKIMTGGLNQRQQEQAIATLQQRRAASIKSGY